MTTRPRPATMARVTTPPTGPVPAQFKISMPPEEEAGHYADFANVWHNAETFILDFAAMSKPPELAHDEHGNPFGQINARVVTRVRIPSSQVWELMKALEQQLTAWEAEKAAQPGGTPPRAPQ